MLTLEGLVSSAVKPTDGNFLFVLQLKEKRN